MNSFFQRHPLRCLLATLAILVGTTPSTSAEEPIPAPQLAELKALFSSLSNKPVLTQPDASLLMREILKRDNITPTEVAFLRNYLGENRDATLSVGEKSYAFPSPDKQARHYLNYFVDTSFNLNDLWLQGPEAMRDYVDIYATALSTEKRLTNFAASKFWAAWQESPSDLIHKPLHNLVHTYYSQIEHLEGSRARAARQLAYSAIYKVDQAANDGVPGSMYNWLRPTDED